MGYGKPAKAETPWFLELKPFFGIASNSESDDTSVRKIEIASALRPKDASIRLLPESGETS
jgi:hypothetical protein